jgi:[acyl-carrier-protein] S-malonyltransferase
MMYALLCPGQGAQHRGMLDLVHDHPSAQRVLRDASSSLGVDVTEWLENGESIFRNDIAQPLICSAQLATWSALRDNLPAPACIAGYSVGELASYACADALDAHQLAQLASERARLMQQALGHADGGLVAVRGLRRSDLDRLCADRPVWPAIIRGEINAVLGGETSALHAAATDAKALGAEIRYLKVGVPAHTPLLGTAVPRFAEVLEKSAMGSPGAAVIAGVDGGPVSDRARGIMTLAQQIAHTIDWGRCMDTLHERGCRVFLELCPGSTLSALVRERFGDVEARAIDDFRSLQGAVHWVQSRLR